MQPLPVWRAQIRLRDKPPFVVRGKLSRNEGAPREEGEPYPFIRAVDRGALGHDEFDEHDRIVAYLSPTRHVAEVAGRQVILRNSVADGLVLSRRPRRAKVSWLKVARPRILGWRSLASLRERWTLPPVSLTLLESFPQPSTEIFRPFVTHNLY